MPVIPVRTNYLYDPSFEGARDENGLPLAHDPVAQAWAVAGVIVYSRVPAITGSGDWALRIQYTGVAGDVSASLGFAMKSHANAFGTCVGPADYPATCSVTVDGALTGCVMTLVTSAIDSTGAGVAGSTVISDPLTITASPVRFSVTNAALPDTSENVAFVVHVAGIGEGDVVDFTIDDAMIERSATMGSYFDGSYLGFGWASNDSSSLSRGPNGNSVTSAPYGPPLVLVEGDSMTAPDGVADWPYILSTLAPNWSIINVARGAEYLTDETYGFNVMHTQAPHEVDSHVYDSYPAICVIYGGFNDLSGNDTSAQIYSNIANYCYFRRAAGWKVLVGTYTSREGATGGGEGDFATKRNLLNALLVADHSFADGLFDVAADPDIGGDHASLDLTYFAVSGEIHINAAGHAIVAQLVRDEIIALGVSNPIGAALSAASDVAATLQDLEIFRGDVAWLHLALPCSLDGCTVAWEFANAPGGAALATKAATVINAPAGTADVALEAADTSSLPGGFYYHEAVVTTPDGLVKTLLYGRLLMHPDII